MKKIILLLLFPITLYAQADLTTGGETISTGGFSFSDLFIAGENLTKGDICYFGAGKMFAANNSDPSTSEGLLGIVLQDLLINEVGQFLLNGKYLTTGLTANSQYYVATVGGMTDIKPSSPNIVRSIGFALTTEILYLLPTFDGLEYIVGVAGTYDDVRVSLVGNVKIPASNYPTWTRVFRNLAETSTGVYSYCFSAATEEYVFFELQMPHDWWITGTPVVEPHIHWIKPDHIDTLNVVWGLEFNASTPGEAFYDTTFTVYSRVHPTVGIDDGTTANVEYITDWPEIDMTGFSYSTVFICRVFRAATQPLDDYAQNACAVSFDFHYKKRPRGTTTEYGD